MIIRGIRSFAPENNTAIVFYKPLTLIVGSNGAGKTVRLFCCVVCVARLLLHVVCCVLCSSDFSSD